jgi:hypothetical protein
MRMKQYVIGLAALLASLVAAAPSRAEDLFENRSFKEKARDTLIQPGDTVGGYPVFHGGGTWHLLEGKSTVNPGPSALWMGQVTMYQGVGPSNIAMQTITANLNQSFGAAGWRGGPCTNEHLYKRFDASGKRESCVTIDPVAFSNESGGTLHFRIMTLNTDRNGKYLMNDMYVTAWILGFRERSLNAWNRGAVDADPARKALMDRLQTWADRLSADASRALDQDADAYAATPTTLSLVPVPPSLKGQDLSPYFLGHLDELARAPGPKALAFASLGSYETIWSAVTNRASTDEAERVALADCEKQRRNREAPCRLYKFQ